MLTLRDEDWFRGFKGIVINEYKKLWFNNEQSALSRIIENENNYVKFEAFIKQKKSNSFIESDYLL